MAQVELLVRHYLHTEPAKDIDNLVTQYVAAIWIEERVVDNTARAIAKALGGNKGS